MSSKSHIKWFQPTLKDLGPPKIKNHTVTHHNDLLYCFGGYDGHVNHMTLMIYIIERQQWTVVLSENDIYTNNSSGGLRYDRGGNGNHGNNINSTYNRRRNTGLSPAEMEECYPYTMIGKPPPGRNGHTATLAKRMINNEERTFIFIIGGWLGTGPFAASDLHLLDITNPEEALVWVPVPPGNQEHSPGPCNMHSADFIPSKNEIYVFRGGNGCEYLNELHAIDVNALTWRNVETFGESPQQRANHTSAFLVETSQLFIFGGWNGKERLNDIHILDINTSTWSCPNVHGSLPHPRAGMSLTALKGKLYLFGGSGTSSKFFHDLHVLDPVEMTWLEIVQQEDDEENSKSKIIVDDLIDQFDETNIGDSNKISIIESNESFNAEDWRSQELMDRHSDNHNSGGGGGGGIGIGSKATKRNDNDFLFSTSINHNSRSAANPNEIENEPSIIIRGTGPSRRAGHTATAVDRFIYVFGGSCGTHYLSDFFILDSDPPKFPQVTKPTSQKLVGNRLKYLCNSEEFADVIFIVEGRRIYAHKLILALASDFYGAMFAVSNGFRETSSGSPEIDVPNCTYDTFLSIMEYIYTGNDPDFGMESLEKVVEILQLADQLLLDHLKQRCEQILHTFVNDNCVEYLLQVAMKTNALQLESVCSHYIRNHPTMNE